VPCPACGEFQVLKWGQVKDPRFPGVQPAVGTRYECEHCQAHWTDAQRWDACERGEWRGSVPFAGVAGFWISELYSPWKRLGQLVDDFLAKKDNPSELQTFVNTTLAETWKEQGDAPSYEVLMSRREEYKLGDVPAGVAVLTAGVDVQKTWMQGHVWGWGPHRQRWLVDRFIIQGSPFLEATWEELTSRLNEEYRSASGAPLSIARIAVDTGFATQEAYHWARVNGSRVMAVDGRPSGAALVLSPTQVDLTYSGKKIKRGCKLYGVNVSMAKSELYGLLAKERPADGDPYPPGWVHFPCDVDQDFFKQLTAEHLTTHIVKGYRKTEWIKTGPNHDLDCHNYARAAAFSIGVDRYQDQHWARLGVTAAPVLPARHVAESAPVASVPEVTPSFVPQYRPPAYQGRNRIVGRFAL